MPNVSRRALRAVAAALGGRPVPVAVVRAIRLLARGTNPLLPRARRGHVTGRAIREPTLRHLLADDELGTWALGPDVINWLERQLGDLRPRLVLEFGSGISTVCLARFLVNINGPEAVLRVVSIDQDETYAAQTRERLRRAGLEPYVQVLSAPLSEQVIEGLTTTCYEMPRDLGAILAGRRADFALIDGPAAATRMRFGTLPLARPYLAPTAAFALDDGLRDGEIWVAAKWSALAGVRVHGVLNIGKGVVVGRLTGEAAPDPKTSAGT